MGLTLVLLLKFIFLFVFLGFAFYILYIYFFGPRYTATYICIPGDGRFFRLMCRYSDSEKKYLKLKLNEPTRLDGGLFDHIFLSGTFIKRKQTPHLFKISLS